MSEEPKIFVADIPIDRSKFIFPDSAAKNYEEARKLIEQSENEKAIEKLKLAAEENHPAAIHELGCYLQLAHKYTEALDWFHKSASLGLAASIYNIASFYSLGLGVGVSHVKAFQYNKQAAELGHPRAMFQLGSCYMKGEGVAEDKKEGVEWYLKAAKSGDNYAPYSLGVLYRAGMEGVVEKDLKEAQVWLEKGAQLGDDNAQFLLGMAWKNGEFGTKDLYKAVKYLNDAAQSMHGGALLQLAKLSLKSDIGMALGYVQHATQVAFSSNDANLIFLIGEFVEQEMNNPKASITIYQRGAALGHAGCQFNLGLVLTMVDMAGAIQLLKLAASQNHREAFFTLGKIYAEGYEVPVDKEEGKKWLTLAAAAGDATAQQMLDSLK